MPRIRLPIRPAAARQLLKVVQAMHREVDGRLTQLESLLEDAAGTRARAPRRAKKRR